MPLSELVLSRELCNRERSPVQMATMIKFSKTEKLLDKDKTIFVLYK